MGKLGGKKNNRITDIFLRWKIIQSLNPIKAKLHKLLFSSYVDVLQRENNDRIQLVSHWHIIGGILLGGKVEFVYSSVDSCLQNTSKNSKGGVWSTWPITHRLTS